MTDQSNHERADQANVLARLLDDLVYLASYTGMDIEDITRALLRKADDLLVLQQALAE
jgi:hypothetical protein